MKICALLACAVGSLMVAGASMGQALRLGKDVADAIAPHLDADQVSVVSLDWTNAAGAWSRPLELGQRQVVLDLAPRSLRGPDFKMMVTVAPGLTVEMPAPPSATHWGNVRNMPGSIAAISFVAGKAQGIVILDSGETWYLQPASDLVPGAGAQEYLVYPASAALASGGHCGVGDEHVLEAELSTAGGIGILGPGTCNRLCQIAMDADFEYYTDNGSTTAGAQAALEAALNNVQAIYVRDVNVTFSLTGTVIRTTDVVYTGGTSSTLLGTMRSEWQANQTGLIPRDTAHMLTGKATGGTLGVAYVNAMCGSFAYGWSQNRNATAVASRTATTAHELGHNFSASHCDDDPDCAIMCAFINGCASNITKFSARSATQIRTGAASSCLSAAPGFATSVTPGANNDIFVVTSNSVTTTFDPLANDGDGNCLPLTITSFSATGSAGGTMVRSVGTGPGGRDRLTYTSPPAPVRFETFTYTVSDGTLSSTATIYIDNQRRVPATSVLRTRSKLDVAYFALASGVSTLPNYNAFTPYLRSSVDTINTASGSGVFLDSGRSTLVGAVFTGYFSMPAAGSYRFALSSDDGSRLIIDGLTIIDNNGVHGMREREGIAYMAAGLHPIRVEFFQGTGSRGLTLSYESIDGTTLVKQIIPAERLFRDGCLADVAILGGAAGQDNQLTADDLVLFIAEFFNNNLTIADVATIGGNPVPDGVTTVDDILVFLTAFFAGCTP